ncbi:hypothetical protein JTB14_025177 [Gonioctena quinquepunctata]|nr:hypothetical protein JTB14_025177 [Gonioctena quinquepunctata]
MEEFRVIWKIFGRKLASSISGNDFYPLLWLNVIIEPVFELLAEFTECDCDQPHTLPGVTCKGRFIRYHWNNTEKKCEEVIFGGCRETRNNFKTSEDCQWIAGVICADS